MSSIYDIVAGIASSIGNIPQLIFNLFISILTAIKDLLIELIGAVGDVVLAILDIPLSIVEVLLDLFVPDVEYIQTAFNGFLDGLKMKFSVDTSFFESVFQNEQPVTDISTEYYITGVGSFNLKFLDTSFLVQGVTYFRPFIRGFIVLLLGLFNIRQLVSFFGYDAGVVAGRSEHIKNEKNAQ